MERVTCPHCGHEHKTIAERCPITGAVMPKALTRLVAQDDLATEETAGAGGVGDPAGSDIMASGATSAARSDPGQDLFHDDVVLGRPAASDQDRPQPGPHPGGGADPFQDAEDRRSAAEGVRLALRLPYGQTVPLNEGPAVALGRDSASPIANACGDNISRRHAEVRVAQEGPVIVDVGSANGTYVNEQRLRHGEEQPLRPRDVVRLANDPPLRIEVIASGADGERR